jgi:hypothetical protein
LAKLHIMNGPSKGQVFDLVNDVYTIGRSPSSDIQVRDNTVSRNHLKIFRMKNEFFIEDLNSKNGTFVNGERVHVGVQVPVKRGIPFAVGRVFLNLSENHKTADEVEEGPKPKKDSLPKRTAPKVRAEKDLEALDAIDLSKEWGHGGADLVRDRSNASQKNMSLIAKVNDVLREALGINEILEKMLNCILDFFTRIDRGFFILFDEETGKLSEVIKVFNRDENEVPSTYSRTIVDRVRKEKKALLMLDTLNEESAELSESLKLMQIRSVMCVPLISRSKIRGVIYVDTINEPNGFRKDDLFLLTALSSPTAVVIENALLALSKEKPKTK